MSDILSKFTKWLDRDRYTALGLAFVPIVLSGYGCALWDGKVDSSTTGEIVDIDGLNQEYTGVIADIEASIEAKYREIRAANEEIEVLVLKAEAAAENYTFDFDRIEAELKKRDETIGGLANIAKPFVATLPGGESILSAALLAFGVGGAGYGVGRRLDINRKNKVIETLKSGAAK